jgi:two-component sensor histidine kinase
VKHVLRRLSLRSRLAFLIAGSTLPLILAAGILIYQNYQEARRTAAERIMQTARGMMAAVDDELQDAASALKVLAQSPALQRRDLAAFRADAERFTAEYPAGHTISLADRDAQQVFNSGAAADTPLPPRSDRDTVRAVFATARPHVSNIFIGSLLKRPIFTVDVPILIDGAVAYDLAFNPPLERFHAIIDAQRLPPDWVISIFDRTGAHVARRPQLAPNPAGMLTRAAPSLAVQMASAAEGIGETIAIEGTPLLTAFTRSPETGWVVAMGLPSNSITGPALRSLAATLSVGLVFLAVGLAFALRLATGLARAEADRELLIHELNHRVKNTLSMVQSIVTRSLRGTPDGGDARAAIEARLMALSRAHNVLSERFWQGAGLMETVASVLEAHQLAEPGRIAVTGPDIALKPQSALALAMIVNELATNAIKYGALSVAGGGVALSWELGRSGGDPACRMQWKEHGGPPIGPPARKGFGSTLIERSVRDQLDGTITMEFAASGLVCIMQFPLGANAQAAAV